MTFSSLLRFHFVVSSISAFVVVNAPFLLASATKKTKKWTYEWRGEKGDEKEWK